MARQRKTQDSTASEPAQHGTGGSYTVEILDMRVSGNGKRISTSSMWTETIDLGCITWILRNCQTLFVPVATWSEPTIHYRYIVSSIMASRPIEVSTRTGRKATFSLPTCWETRRKGGRLHPFGNGVVLCLGLLRLRLVCLSALNQGKQAEKCFGRRVVYVGLCRNSSFWCNLWQLISASLGSLGVSCSFDSICRGSLGANKPYCSAAACFCSWSFQWACWALAYPDVHDIPVCFKGENLRRILTLLCTVTYSYIVRKHICKYVYVYTYFM